MLKYLVVGVNGTIGSALFSRLQLSEANVYGTTYKEHHLKSQNIFHLNLLDSPSSWNFYEHNFDVVYLCAGVCRMALCEDDPTTTSKANVEGMVALARMLSATGAFIVYLSTNQVFSGEEPYAAIDTPYAPLNEYGSQKAQTEMLIKSHCERYAIVRLTKVIENALHQGSLFKNWIELLVEHKAIEAFADMTLAPISLRQVLEVLLSVGRAQQTGCYQVSGSQDITYAQLAQYVAESLGRPLDLVQSVSALEKGIKKKFLPRFTTLDCLSTIALCGETPPHFSEVVDECFGII